MFSFLFFSFFIFFRQASSKLLDSFTMVLAKKLSSAPAHRFFATLKPDEVVRTSHWRTMALATLFSKNCTHVHKSLSNETIITLDCWIRNMVVCMKTGRVFGIHSDSVFEDSLVSDFSANTYWGSLWGRTCCSVIDGKLQLKHAPASKKLLTVERYVGWSCVLKCFFLQSNLD